MATQYPDGIDSTSSLPYVTNGTSPMVGDDVNRLRDAIVAVETELGINPSGTFTSVDARLGEAEAAIAGYANSTFLVLSADGFVSQERVFSPSVNFDVVDGGAGANFEIDLAANVGIGTITPASDYSLTLDGDGATRIGGVTLRNTGTDTFYIGSATASDSANISLMNPNAGYVTLGTDGTERIRITSTGDVGLGTSLPAGRLHVSGGDLLVDTGDVGIGTVSPAGRLHVSGGDLLVDTGDVGIGTLTPSERLHVSGGNLLLESAAGAGLPYATMKGTQGGFQMSSGNGIGKLDVLDSTGAVTISLLNNVDNRLVGVNNADFSFYTNNTEKMRITAGGDLLVNSITNPDLARLHISGGGITHSSSQFNARPGAGVNYEWVNRNGAGHTWYVNSASAQAMTLTSAGNFGIGTSLPVSQFSVGSSSEFRVDSSGDITRISDVPYTFPVVQGVASSVLKNNGSGSLDWSLLADTEIIGGLRVIEWDDGAYGDVVAALLDLVPVPRRVNKMVVMARETSGSGLVHEMQWNGSTFIPWIPLNSPISKNFGSISITGSVIANSFILSGDFVDGTGNRKTLNYFDTSGSAGNRFIFWDNSAGAVAIASGLGGADQGDMPLFFLVRAAGGVITKVVPCHPTSRGFWSDDSVFVGDDAHFSNLHAAIVFCSAFAGLAAGAAPRRVVLTTSIFNNPLIMTGTASVASAATAVVGVGTKFRSEFRAGDFVYFDGNVPVEVASVASDTAMTLLLPWASAAVTGGGIERATYIGPNGYSFDTDKEEFANITDMIGMEFVGFSGKFSPDVNERPLISWGRSDTKIDPLFNFKSSFSPKQWKFSGLGFSGICARNVADDTQSMFFNVREGWSFDNCSFSNGFNGSTTVKMTNIFAWSLTTNLGSDASESNDTGMIFERCVFHKSGAGLGSAIFKTSVILSGSARLNNCKIHGDDSDADDRPDYVWDLGATASTVSIVHDDGVVRGVRNAFFRHTHASATMATAPKTIRNIRFGATGTFFKLVDNGAIAAGARCSVYDCQVANDINMEGCHLAVGLRSTAGIITIPAYMLSIGCEYFSVSGSSYGRGMLQAGSVTTDTHRLSATDMTGTLGVTTLNHVSDPADTAFGVAGMHFVRAQELALTTTFGAQCSRIMSGGGADFDGTTFRLKPGTFRFADGTVLSTTGNLTITGLGSGDGARYLYVNTVGALVVGGTPNTQGHDGTNTRCYVGSVVSDSGSVTGCRVATLGTGIRMVTFGNNQVGDAALMGEDVSTAITSTSGGSDHNMLDATNDGLTSDAPRTVFPTARWIRWSIGFWYGPAAVYAAGGGFGVLHSAEARFSFALPLPATSNSYSLINGTLNTNSRVSQTLITETWSLNCLPDPDLTVNLPGPTGEWQFTYATSITAYAEDVNAPTPWL